MGWFLIGLWIRVRNIEDWHLLSQRRCMRSNPGNQWGLPEWLLIWEIWEEMCKNWGKNYARFLEDIVVEWGMLYEYLEDIVGMWGILGAHLEDLVGMWGILWEYLEYLVGVWGILSEYEKVKWIRQGGFSNWIRGREINMYFKIEYLNININGGVGWARKSLLI